MSIFYDPQSYSAANGAADGAARGSACPAEGGPFRLTTTRLKRVFDFSLAALALFLFAPLFLLVYLAVRFSSSGPVFYGHERVGQSGKAFKCLKFRTMVTNGDEVLERHLSKVEGARLEWESTRKLRNDPRITPIGGILRSSSIDELPQLFNILKGEMSVVGPRPVVHGELAYYGAYVTHYYATRPGLTGLWQVSGRNDVSYQARVEFDRTYVENWSMAGDIMLVLRTIPAVLMRRGTY